MAFNCGPIDGNIGRMTAKACQQWIADQGENPGPIDGNFGDMTAAAFQRFLKKQGARYDPGPIDGKFRDGRNSTQKFQTWLSDRGYDPGPIDGIWGAQTVCALQRFLNALNAQAGGEKVVWMKMSAKELMSKDCSAGSLNFNEKVSIGCTTDMAIAAKVYGEVSGKASFAVGEASAKAGMELSASFAMKNSKAAETNKIFSMDPGSPAYVYQMCVEAKTNKGNYVAWDCNVKMTDKPLTTMVVEKTFR